MDKKTIDTYNEMTEEYDAETIDFWERFPSTFIEKFSESVKGSVLDVGSGPGRDALILQKAGLDVTCLDASEEMIKRTKEKGFKSVIADFLDIPFPDNSFDGVWAYTAILHVPKSEVRKAIQEIKRVLKPNGVLGLGLIEGETEGYIESSGVNRPRYFAYYNKKEVEELLKEFDFQIFSFDKFKPETKNYLHFLARKK